MTGTPLIGGKKMQLNFQMKQVEGVNMTNGVRDTLFPVAWMYEVRHHHHCLRKNWGEKLKF